MSLYESVIDKGLQFLVNSPDTANALMGAFLDGDGTAASILKTIGSMGGELSGLSTLIRMANEMGDMFGGLYGRVTGGGNYVGDVGDFYANLPTRTPDATFVACERLSEDIRKALETEIGRAHV